MTAKEIQGNTTLFTEMEILDMMYKTKGTCSSAIEYSVENGILTSCRFIGGCMGNTQGVARLAEGRPVEEVISLLDGIQCGFRGTSCPDQLARALKGYQKKNS